MKQEAENLLKETKGEITERIFKVNRTDSQGEVRTIYQYQYMGWPDHGVPETPTEFLQLLKKTDEKKTKGPVIVHCSAGIGRTGTFCAVHYTLELIEAEKKQNKDIKLNIAETVLNLRKLRNKMVQTYVRILLS